jgi:hypothetical protein
MQKVCLKFLKRFKWAQNPAFLKKYRKSSTDDPNGLSTIPTGSPILRACITRRRPLPPSTAWLILQGHAFFGVLHSFGAWIQGLCCT